MRLSDLIGASARGGPYTLLDAQTFSATGNWVKPPGAVWVRVIGCGGGQGGRGGAGNDSSSNTSSTNPAGGNGGEIAEYCLLAHQLGATELVTIGAGGAGSAGGAGTMSIIPAIGNLGEAGGMTLFGEHCVWQGGPSSSAGLFSSSSVPVTRWNNSTIIGSNLGNPGVRGKPFQVAAGGGTGNNTSLNFGPAGWSIRPVTPPSQDGLAGDIARGIGGNGGGGGEGGSSPTSGGKGGWPGGGGGGAGNRNGGTGSQDGVAGGAGGAGACYVETWGIAP